MRIRYQQAWKSLNEGGAMVGTRTSKPPTEKSGSETVTWKEQAHWIMSAQPRSVIKGSRKPDTLPAAPTTSHTMGQRPAHRHMCTTRQTSEHSPMAEKMVAFLGMRWPTAMIIAKERALCHTSSHKSKSVNPAHSSLTKYAPSDKCVFLYDQSAGSHPYRLRSAPHENSVLKLSSAHQPTATTKTAETMGRATRFTRNEGGTSVRKELGSTIGSSV
mmetsp:Transcript_55065/g.126636  ORF Transcript_55065/g.126636 Transcript_55065/m.126636 type:complete len:216 (+) Transcript_55065:147-794(+)